MDWFDHSFVARIDGGCSGWDAGVVYVHAFFDFVIFLAYVIIPIFLARLTKAQREHVPRKWITWAFASFILSCGLTHLFDTVASFHAWGFHVWLVTKIVCAIASIATVIAMPSFLRYEESRPTRDEIQEVNARLVAQVQMYKSRPDYTAVHADLAAAMKLIQDLKARMEHAGH